ncbi:MAG: hypothetical protein ACYTX0_59295, partial [Nostoc sp.]
KFKNQSRLLYVINTCQFGANELQQTRFYQDVFEEGRQEGIQESKLKVIPHLLALGLILHT